VLAAIEEKYGKGNGEQRAEECAQLPFRGPVVRHVHLR
jgi:hypothetical protein